MSHFCWLFVLWQDHLGDLCTVIRNKDAELARRWSKSEQWCTVIQFMQAAKGKMVPSISFFFPVIFCPSLFFLFFFFFKFFLLNSPNLQREGPYAGIDWLSFFFTSSTAIFFYSTILIKLEPSACRIFFFLFWEK